MAVLNPSIFKFISKDITWEDGPHFRILIANCSFLEKRIIFNHYFYHLKENVKTAEIQKEISKLIQSSIFSMSLKSKRRTLLTTSRPLWYVKAKMKNIGQSIKKTVTDKNQVFINYLLFLFFAYT